MSKRGKRRVRNSKAGRQNLRGIKKKNSQRRKGGSARKARPARPKPAPTSQRAKAQTQSTSSAEFQSEISMLEMQERSIQHRINLESIQSEINHVANAFVEIPMKLAEANKRGFVFTKDMDDALALVEDEWMSEVEQQVTSELDNEIKTLGSASRNLDRTMAQLSKPNKLIVDRAESLLDQVEGQINSSESRLRGRYSAIKETLDEIYDDLKEAHTALDLLNDSEIELRGSESIVLVAEAEWEIDGEDEGPDGYLYLTDQRLLFEQKEEVAEKKFLFITTKSTEVQKLLMDVELRNIDTIEHSEEKRRTLQWGADEILSMTLSGQADLSRLRFHIKNQEAEDWKETLKYVLSGEIQEDRFDFDEGAKAAVYIFPAACPSCMAAIPPQPGGVSAYECEFCGATVQAELG